jgi:hypothetical protein
MMATCSSETFVPIYQLHGVTFQKTYLPPSEPQMLHNITLFATFQSIRSDLSQYILNQYLS